jgi:hypothetical protein
MDHVVLGLKEDIGQLTEMAGESFLFSFTIRDSEASMLPWYVGS